MGIEGVGAGSDQLLGSLQAVTGKPFDAAVIEAQQGPGSLYEAVEQAKVSPDDQKWVDDLAWAIAKEVGSRHFYTMLDLTDQVDYAIAQATKKYSECPPAILGAARYIARAVVEAQQKDFPGEQKAAHLDALALGVREALTNKESDLPTRALMAKLIVNSADARGLAAPLTVMGKLMQATVRLNNKDNFEVNNAMDSLMRDGTLPEAAPAAAHFARWYAQFPCSGDTPQTEEDQAFAEGVFEHGEPLKLPTEAAINNAVGRWLGLEPDHVPHTSEAHAAARRNEWQLFGREKLTLIHKFTREIEAAGGARADVRLVPVVFVRSDTPERVVETRLLLRIADPVGKTTVYMDRNGGPLPTIEPLISAWGPGTASFPKDGKVELDEHGIVPDSDLYTPWPALEDAMASDTNRPSTAEQQRTDEMAQGLVRWVKDHRRQEDSHRGLEKALDAMRDAPALKEHSPVARAAALIAARILSSREPDEMAPELSAAVRSEGYTLAERAKIAGLLLGYAAEASKGAEPLAMLRDTLRDVILGSDRVLDRPAKHALAAEILTSGAAQHLPPPKLAFLRNYAVEQIDEKFDRRSVLDKIYGDTVDYGKGQRFATTKNLHEAISQALERTGRSGTEDVDKTVATIQSVGRLKGKVVFLPVVTFPGYDDYFEAKTSFIFAVADRHGWITFVSSTGKKAASIEALLPSLGKGTTYYPKNAKLTIDADGRVPLSRFVYPHPHKTAE